MGEAAQLTVGALDETETEEAAAAMEAKLKPLGPTGMATGRADADAEAEAEAEEGEEEEIGEEGEATVVHVLATPTTR